MARLARVVAVDVPHHITQRGNARRFILQDEPDRTVYFELLQEYTAQYQVAVIGYCLMSNHVHLVAVPSRAEVLARALKETHGRFASYWNARHNSNGHVWQGRYYSCPLDNTHLWEALRYTEMNPVRASLVEKAEQWSWSSASAHCGVEPAGEWMAMDLWASHWSPGDWRSYLDVGTSGSTLTAIRRSTFSGRPLGSEEFTRAVETETKRCLTPQKRGPKRRTNGEPQEALLFNP